MTSRPQLAHVSWRCFKVLSSEFTFEASWNFITRQLVVKLTVIWFFFRSRGFRTKTLRIIFWLIKSLSIFIPQNNFYFFIARLSEVNQTGVELWCILLKQLAKRGNVVFQWEWKKVWARSRDENLCRFSQGYLWGFLWYFVFDFLDKCDRLVC